MRAHLFGLVVAAVLSGATESAAQSFTNDFYTAKGWRLYDQTDDGVFSQCVARKEEQSAGTRLQIGRHISGDDFIQLYGVNNLVGANETSGNGKVFINGNDGYDFSNQGIRDSVVEQGSKFITIYLASGFIDKIAAAKSIRIQLSGGDVSHNLKGSREMIGKLNDCMDAALNKDNGPSQLVRPPEGWTKGDTPDGRIYLSLALKPVNGQDRYFGIVDAGNGAYDLRVRSTSDALGRPLEQGGETRRFAASLSSPGMVPVSLIALRAGDDMDLPGLTAANLKTLPPFGQLSVKSIEPGDGFEGGIEMSSAISMGVSAMLAPLEAQETTYGTLVGSYYVRGRNPSGKYYYGTAETTYAPGQLQVKWIWSDKSEATGVANLVASVVTAVVENMNAPVIYNIGKDGVWRGTWDQGRGIEIMVPQGY